MTESHKKVRSYPFRLGKPVRMPRQATILDLIERNGNVWIVALVDDRHVTVPRDIFGLEEGGYPEGEYIGSVLMNSGFLDLKMVHLFDRGDIILFGDEDA